MRSMTGYGKTSISNGGITIVCECRSLNSKGLDLNLKLPSLFRELEGEVRKLISNELIRGKVDVSYSVERTQEESPLVVNEALFESYLSQLKGLSAKHSLNDSGLMQFILKMPEVLSADRTELTKEELNALVDATKGALKNLNAFREKEGGALNAELKDRITNIERLSGEVAEKDGDRVNEIRGRLKQKLDELKDTDLDPGRLEQEMIFYTEKLDITEEKVRLKTHCDHFLSTMKDVGSGRKLGFISQEIGREINTIGSKANDANIQKMVVQMKDELEKIKEQVLNVL